MQGEGVVLVQIIAEFKAIRDALPPLAHTWVLRPGVPKYHHPDCNACAEQVSRSAKDDFRGS